MELETLRRVADPLARAREAGTVQEDLQRAGVEVSRIRREAIEELINGGMTKAAIASELGMTRGRISQLVASGPPPERLFFGDDRITVALGGKYEAVVPDKKIPGHVYPKEDVRAFVELGKLFSTLKLDFEHEIVAPPGIIDLNRDNLMVMCGPRLSPILYQILASDPYLGFEKDENGWYLVNKQENEVIRSGQDSGDPSDAAYFGRLPRPDGKGYFLYVAGIHANGSSGVVHYLDHHLSSLYRSVRLRRFSMLIGCKLDEKGIVDSSYALSPIFDHDSKQGL